MPALKPESKGMVIQLMSENCVYKCRAFIKSKNKISPEVVVGFNSKFY